MRAIRRWAVLSAMLVLNVAGPDAAAATPASAPDPYAYDYAKGCLHRTQAATRALETWLREARPRGNGLGQRELPRDPVSAEAVEAYEACLREREREEDRARREGIVCERPRPTWSLHAEGRALDRRLDAAIPAEKREADRLVKLLLRPDAGGEPHALARRMGIQEIIWNCRAWYAGAPAPGPYGPCFEADGKRRAGVDRTLAHRDHIHLGLHWAGARMRTSFWQAKERLWWCSQSGKNECVQAGKALDREANTTEAAPWPAQVTVAVVLQVREKLLQVLLWQRALDPERGAWALPGGYLDRREALEGSLRRHLAVKVDVRELSRLEQLETRSSPDRHPEEWQLATAYLGLVPGDVDPELPADTAWHPVDSLPRLAFDFTAVTLLGRERLRAKLSYTNIGYALAPERFTMAELRDIYTAALGYAVSTTNLQRVLVRRGVLELTGERREPGPAGGRPAGLYSFRTRELEVTDPFAVLRPPA